MQRQLPPSRSQSNQTPVQKLSKQSAPTLSAQSPTYTLRTLYLRLRPRKSVSERDQRSNAWVEQQPLGTEPSMASRPIIDACSTNSHLGRALIQNALFSAHSPRSQSSSESACVHSLPPFVARPRFCPFE